MFAQITEKLFATFTDELVFEVQVLFAHSIVLAWIRFAGI